MKRILIITFGLFLSIGVFAQNDHTIYFMNAVGQVTYANPANLPSARVNISLPLTTPISFPSNYIAFSNSGFVMDDLLQDDGDSLVINMDNFIDKLKSKNYLTLDYHLDLLNIGFQLKEKNYVGINITEKFSTSFTYPRDMFNLLWNGNGKDLLGERASFDGFGLDVMHYREYGVHYARKLMEDKLVLGGRVKYLYGMENINTASSNIGVTTDESTFDLAFDAEMSIQTSGLPNLMDSADSFEVDPSKYISFSGPNKGFGIDLGANYKINDKFGVSASITDLGSIKWMDDVNNYSLEGDFSFTGLDILDMVGSADTNQASVNADTTDTWALLIDSLQGSFQFDDNKDSYRTSLGPRIYLGGTFNLNENNTVGLLYYSTVQKGRMRNGLTVSMNTRVKKFLSASLSYSMYHRGYSNLGVGLALSGGPFQWYFITDNVLFMVAPEKFRNGHVRVGINWAIGRKGKDKDMDGVSDSKDKCPELPGLEKFFGCPDTDLDGIADNEDMCPKVYGLAQFGGCPDTDGDGIGDLDDACMEVAGLPEFNGCPDTDGDGVADSEDDCPNKAGEKEFGGCPDTDGDGVVDNEDLCPEKAGTLVNFGCPITKLTIMGIDGIALMTVDMNEDGFFVFDNLPADKQYLFQMDGEDVFLTDELLILFNNNGEQKMLTASQTDGNRFKYQYLPAAADEEVTLLIVDDEGNILRSGYRDEKGNFVFENLPTNQEYLFRIDGKDVDLGEMLDVIIRNADGDYKMSIKKEEAPSGFDFQFLPNNDKFGLAQVEYSDEGSLVILSIEEKEVVKQAFDHLEFTSGKAVLRPKSFESLDELAGLMKEKPEWKIVLRGHTDNSGSEMHNLALSKMRTDAVKRHLIDSGVDAVKIIVKYFGESQPLADNTTEEGRQKNRRVEMEIVD